MDLGPVIFKLCQFILIICNIKEFISQNRKPVIFSIGNHLLSAFPVIDIEHEQHMCNLIIKMGFQKFLMFDYPDADGGQ